jgi:periplasmic divalent cation tolerance protein
MQSSSDHLLVFMTAPDAEMARQIARAALEARCVACANLIPQVESHYWWQGKLDQSNEVLVLFKTLRSHLPKLEEVVLGIHPYDTPELVVADLTEGTKKYLDWVRDSVRRREA